jgi:hypothetical protein
MPYSEIAKGFTFYGLLPPGSPKEHLAIVLNQKEELVKYCYCTSTLNLKLLRYTQTDCFIIKQEKMMVYFPNNAHDSYIYISEQSIISITLFLLEIKLNDYDFEAKPPLDKQLFLDLIEAIKQSDNLSERFKKELLAFIAEGSK